MPAGNYNTSMEELRDYVRTFTWTDSNGNPVDLSGYTSVEYAVKGELDGVVVLNINSLDNPTQIAFATPRSTGKILLTVPGSSVLFVDTINDRYVHELVIKGGATTVALLRGYVSFVRAVAP